jgi:hypothetical protein
MRRASAVSGEITDAGRLYNVRAEKRRAQILNSNTLRYIFIFDISKIALGERPEHIGKRGMIDALA